MFLRSKLILKDNAAKMNSYLNNDITPVHVNIMYSFNFVRILEFTHIESLIFSECAVFSVPSSK